MHNEYAVDPNAIALNWESCRYLSEKFGFEHGRILSLFPKKWAREAMDSINPNLGDYEKARILAKIKYLKDHCSVSSGRGFGDTGSWLEKAIVQQESNPFHAIIATNKDGVENPCVLTLSEMDENHPKIVSPSSREIALREEALLNAFRGLFRTKSSVTFIDPYFSFFDAGYMNLLSQCLLLIGELNDPIERIVNIHYSTEKKRSNDENIERSPYIESLIIPSNINLKIYDRSVKDQGKILHDRYLLTEKGGFTMSNSFRPVKKPSKAVITLSLIDGNASRKLLEDYSPQSEEYLLKKAFHLDSSRRIKRI